MEIYIKFFSFIKFETGLDEITIQVDDGGTINDLVIQLGREYGDKLTRFLKAKDRDKIISLFVRDNKILRSDEGLNDGDKLKIMPSVGGG